MFFFFLFSKLPPYRCLGGHRLHPQHPQSVFEEDELSEEAAESSASKCCLGYTYFVQLNWLWKVEFSSQPISEYWNWTTTLIPFLQAITHFCNFIPSFLIDEEIHILDWWHLAYS